ncbi:hypothetical protein ACIPM0_22465 [Pseudomonas sichuanensis]|uniref:hypothetical protein n=1 Tax=Pseudomonas sichuanensis TaxID=2213015 RepID=UPI00381152E4
MKTKRDITDWLSHFEIVLSSASTSVFNNSRQQVEVIILAKPQGELKLSDNEFKSLRIVSQKAFGIYDPFPEDNTSAPWFYSTEHDERFDYFPTLTQPTLPEPPTPPGMDEKSLIREDNASYWLNDSETSYKQLYIHSRAPAGSKVTLRVAITRDAEGGGKGEDYYSDDIYVNSIDLYAHPTPNYVFPQDYQWAQTRNEGDTVGGSRFIHEHRLAPIEVPFSYAQFETGDSNGMIRWQDHQPDQTFASHVGIAWPGDKTVHYDTSIRLGAHFPARQVKEVKTDNTGAVIVLLQGDNQIPYYTAGTDRQGPCRVSAYDRHGNRHRLSIAFDDTQSDPLGRRSKLTVVNTSALDEQTTPLRVANIAFFQVKGIGSVNNNTSCPLYNNTYQSTYVDIVIRALDEKQQPVQLTAAELNSIQLVRYDTGTVLGSGYTTYIAATRRSPYDLFDFYPGTAAENSLAPHQNDQAIRFWLTTNTSTNLQVAARLVLGGVTYHTYQKDVTVGGVTVAGKSNSSAIIVPYPRNYDLKPEHFRYGYKNYSNSAHEDIDIYHLWIHDTKYQLRYSSGGDNQHYQNSRNGVQYEQLHYKLDRTREVRVSVWYFNVATINNVPGRAYGSRLRTDSIIERPKKDYGFSIIYYDQNGNGHELWVLNKTGSYGNLLTWNNVPYLDISQAD